MMIAMSKNPYYKNNTSIYATLNENSSCCEKPYFCPPLNASKKQDCKTSDCCCDTSKLREILLTFKLNNTPISIFTETFSSVIFVEPYLVKLYVHAVIDDMVYLSENSTTNQAKYIIPLSSIILVLSFSTLNEFSCIIKEIVTKPMKEKDPCCGVSGIGNAINNLSSFGLSLPTKNLFSFSLSNHTLVIIFASPDFTVFIILFISSISVAANDDICIFYSNYTTDSSSAYAIVPTCKIDHISLPELGCGFKAESRTSTIPNYDTIYSLLSSLPEKSRDKIINLYSEQLENKPDSNFVTIISDNLS